MEYYPKHKGLKVFGTVLPSVSFCIPHPGILTPKNKLEENINIVRKYFNLKFAPRSIFFD
jgi:hypothetical protein